MCGITIFYSLFYFIPLCFLKNGDHAGCHWLTPAIPAIWEADIRRIEVLGQPRQKVCENLSQWKKRWVQWCTTVISAMVGTVKQEDQRSWSQLPWVKISRAERAEGVAEVVEHLPSKHKALTSNPSTVKKKKMVVSITILLHCVKYG
jgi:hypothetical protein